jgi:hypothetical protein
MIGISPDYEIEVRGLIIDKNRFYNHDKVNNNYGLHFSG